MQVTRLSLAQKQIVHTRIMDEPYPQDRLVAIKQWAHKNLNESAQTSSLLIELTKLINTFENNEGNCPKEPSLKIFKEEDTQDIQVQIDITENNRRREILAWAQGLGMQASSYEEVLQKSIEFFYLDVKKLVYSICKRKGISTQTIDFYELINDGAMEVPKLLERYRPQDSDFTKSFLPIRLQGIIKEYLRKLDGLLPGIRRLAKKVEKQNRNDTGDLIQMPSQLISNKGHNKRMFETASYALAVANGKLNISLDPYKAKNEENQKIEMASKTEDPPDMLDIRETIDNKTKHWKTKDKIIFILYNAVGLKIEEIGNIFGVGKSAVSQRFSRLEDELGLSENLKRKSA